MFEGLVHLVSLDRPPAEILRNHRAAYLAIPAEIEARRRTLEWMDQRELS